MQGFHSACALHFSISLLQPQQTPKSIYIIKLKKKKEKKKVKNKSHTLWTLTKDSFIYIKQKEYRKSLKLCHRKRCVSLFKINRKLKNFKCYHS